MQTFNQSLATLVMRKQISKAQALGLSSYPHELEEMLGRGVGVIQHEYQRELTPVGKR
jgi:hypothetical protein